MPPSLFNAGRSLQLGVSNGTALIPARLGAFWILVQHWRHWFCRVDATTELQLNASRFGDGVVRNGPILTGSAQLSLSTTLWAAVLHSLTCKWGIARLNLYIFASLTFNRKPGTAGSGCGIWLRQICQLRTHCGVCSARYAAVAASMHAWQDRVLFMQV